MSVEQGIPSPQGSGLSSPAIRNAGPAAPPTAAQPAGYEPNQNYSKERFVLQHKLLHSFSKYSFG